MNDIIDHKCVKYNLKIWKILLDVDKIILDKDYSIYDWNELFSRIRLDIKLTLSTFLLRNEFDEEGNREIASNNIFNYDFLNKFS